ncbi:MAG TPA: c-type cytochrome [Quisquiliibacterium sp.]|nr:c-type cytochrome [Quisquiliibacterium sp.]
MFAHGEVARLACATLIAAGATAEAFASDSDHERGEEIYRQTCAACHDSGALGAPKIGDRKAWKPLIAEGQRMITRTATKGIRKMPARGGNPALTDREVALAVVYMVNASGGSFKTPK